MKDFRKPETEDTYILTRAEHEVWGRIVRDGWEQMQQFFPRLRACSAPRPSRRVKSKKQERVRFIA